MKCQSREHEAWECSPAFSHSQTGEATCPGVTGPKVQGRGSLKQIGSMKEDLRTRNCKGVLGAFGEGCFWSPEFEAGIVGRGRPAGLSHPRVGCQVQQDTPQSPLAQAQLSHHHPPPRPARPPDTHPPGLEPFPERLRKCRELEGPPWPPGAWARSLTEERRVRGGRDRRLSALVLRGRGFQRNAANSRSEVPTSDPARLEPRPPPVASLEIREAHRSLCGGTRPPLWLL